MEKILIEDILPINIKIKKILTEKFKLTILNARAMTVDLINWQGWKCLSPQETLIVLPGNGASIVKKYINDENPLWLEQWSLKFYPTAKRIWEAGKTPKAFVGRINENILVGIKTVVIVDDVISSGETIRKLQKENENFIQMAEWYGATWVSQKSANTKGFSIIHATATVGTKKFKVPINSLSTLTECPEIAKSYAERNFDTNSDYFLKLLKNLY